MKESEIPRVLFIVPYKARDLEGTALVSHHLRSRHGIASILTNGYGVETKLLEHAPDVLVLDHLAWDFKVRQAQQAKRLGIKVAVLPTEGLFQDQEGAVRRVGKLHSATRLPDLCLLWGDFPRRALLEQRLVEPERIGVTGCPRFDFYAENWRSLSADRATFCSKLGISNWRAPLILWATNTPYASRSARKMLWRQTRRARKPKREVMTHIQDHLVQSRLHTEIVAELSRRHRDWNFIIKVHPAEWVNPYLQVQENHPNVSVAYDAPIREFLLHCDVLLQRNCTTATEAWVLNKAVINMEVGRYGRVVRSEYRGCMDSACSLEEIDGLIGEYLCGRQITEDQRRARKRFVNDFYGSVDGRAAERVADRLRDLVEPQAVRQARWERIQRAASDQQAVEDCRLVNRFKDWLGIPRDRSVRFWKGLFRGEQRDNLGLFRAEAEIARADVEDLCAQFREISRARTELLVIP
jgi:surface carbohydrate biosynthesis protein